MQNSRKRCPEGVHMIQKGNRYLADWRDRKGVRKRKSFTTPEEAQSFEDAQKGQARPPVRGGRNCSKPSRRSSLSAKKAPGTEQQSSSSPSRPASNRANSARRKSPKSTNGASTQKARSRSAAAPSPRGKSSATSGKSSVRQSSDTSSSSRRNRVHATSQSRNKKGKR